MDLNTWVSENLTILLGVPLILIALIVPLMLAVRGQREEGSKAEPASSDVSYVPIVPDSSAGSGDAS